MGYRVEYGPVKKVRGMERRTSRRTAMTGICLLLFLLVISFMWPEGMASVRELLLPGDEAVTAAAMDKLSQDLQSGMGLYESLVEFGRVVLRGSGFGSDR